MGDQDKKYTASVIFCILIFVTLIVVIILAVWVFSQNKNSNCASNDGLNCVGVDPNSPPSNFVQTVQLAVADASGVVVPGTAFNVDINVYRIGNKVTLTTPLINFNVGPISSDNPAPPPVLEGGYVQSYNSFLPEGYRPSYPHYATALFGSGNGLQTPFTYDSFPGLNPINPPITGYNFQVSNTGLILISGAGTPYNVLPSGAHVVQPGSITYTVQPSCNVINNFKLSNGFTNTANFSDPRALSDGVRDSHVVDAYNGVVGWAWTDNSMISDQTNGTVNVMVVIGTKDCNGKLTYSSPVQLTNLPPNQMAWDTAVAINRTNTQNIVVSWLLIDHTIPSPGPSYTYRAVSFDGGKSWPINGPTNIQPHGKTTTGLPGGAGDNRGVFADKYGNFFYCSSNLFTDAGDLDNSPIIWMSTDGGDTWVEIFVSRVRDDDFFPYDFGQVIMGYLEGQYGIYMFADFFPHGATSDALEGLPYIAFIPVNGLGNIGEAQDTELWQFVNICQTPSLAASQDGKFWALGSESGLGPGADIAPGTGYSTLRQLFKSPGALDENWAGPFQVAQGNMFADTIQVPAVWASQPLFGMFNSVQNNTYDNNRSALYSMSNYVFPDNSQNSKIYFLISRDNGHTMPLVFDLASSVNGNRGFQSMALDTATGDLYFGFYDGRNGNSTYQQIEYYGAIITASELDKLVNAIPASNPTYEIPPGPPVPPIPTMNTRKNKKTGVNRSRRYTSKLAISRLGKSK